MACTQHAPCSSVLPCRAHAPHLPPCSWECTLRHTLPATWVAAWLAKPTAKARFMAAVMAKSLAYEQQRDAGGRAFWSCQGLFQVLH